MLLQDGQAQLFTGNPIKAHTLFLNDCQDFQTIIGECYDYGGGEVKVWF